MPEARAEILGRIRQELRHGRPSLSRAEEYERIPREYRQAAALAPAQRVELMVERLRDYDADVIATAERAIADAVAGVLRVHGETVLLAPEAMLSGWLPPCVEILCDCAGADSAILARAQAVLTPCAVAIAETGTLILAHGAEQGRRAATLLPDHHICVLRAEQIVETVPEALARIPASIPLTAISGPSATADIEMVRIRGVHGPRRLTVLLIGGGDA